MTLGQFATAVGATPRWVQNAFAALGLDATYTEPRARRLAFARDLKVACRLPLNRGWVLAPEALAAWPGENIWSLVEPNGVVRVTVDLERFLSTYAVRLSLARCWYAEKARGRPRKGRLKGVAWARWYGVDLSLVQASLCQGVDDRLRRNDEALELFRAFDAARAP
jgi:hypothetical protein